MPVTKRTQGVALPALAALLALSLAGAPGCGYSVRAPFDKTVKTVYVPVFRSITYRRDLNTELTLLVIQEIERRTPFKVVGTREDADTVLDGNINYADKNLTVENPFNLPRQLTATVNASVSWTHNPPTREDIERGPTVISDTVNFTPEIGETTATAFYRVNQNLAKQIVDMMEQAW